MKLEPISDEEHVEGLERGGSVSLQCYGRSALADVVLHTEQRFGRARKCWLLQFLFKYNFFTFEGEKLIGSSFMVGNLAQAGHVK